jgi:hypothetical protein
MNTASSIITSVDSTPGKHLLDSIRAIRAEVGDRLNEDEFTRLLRQTELPIEAEFSFLSYSDRFVTLSVPRQELANWYPEKGWISPAKEKIARAIADKYGLSMCEPPDMAHPCLDSPNPHHHLELCNHLETIIIVHPQFLKIRLFIATSLTQNARIAQRPLLFGPSLLEDLSGLYKT